MATTTGSPADTETRLLDAAERLFAEYGVGAVSLRAVMQEAGTNVAAVHYHFGSKEALLEAVVRRRTHDVTAARAELLAEHGDGPDDAHALALAFLQPVLRIIENGDRDWVRVVSHLLATNDPALAPISTTFFERNADFVARVSRLDPAATPRTISFRLAAAMSAGLRVLGDLERTQLQLAGGGDPWTADEVLAELVDLVASILSGPGRNR